MLPTPNPNTFGRKVLQCPEAPTTETENRQKHGRNNPLNTRNPKTLFQKNQEPELKPNQENPFSSFPAKKLKPELKLNQHHHSCNRPCRPAAWSQHRCTRQQNPKTLTLQLPRSSQTPYLSNIPCFITMIFSINSGILLHAGALENLGPIDSIKHRKARSPPKKRKATVQGSELNALHTRLQGTLVYPEAYTQNYP